MRRLLAAAALAGALCAVPALAGPWFQDATKAAGLSFTHHAARSASWHLPETMGSGGALLDLDGDGDLDVLLLDQGPPPGAPARQGMPRHALLRNDSVPGSGPRFTPLPAPALPGLTAMGACTGDVDRDGDTDVYVTGLPAGMLLLNDGGALRPAPSCAGIVDPGWGTSCVLFDADQDADLDLFVAHYVKWSAAGERRCGGEREGFRAYCPPDEYEAEQDRLFVNGGGSFRDGTESAGLLGERGKGLGVVAADLDGDGRTDLYVANDQTPSALWLCEGPGRFRDAGLLSGTALSEEGRAQAGMGVDAGDVDGDLDLDLTKTNFALETNNLYVRMSIRDGVPRYREGIRPAGLAQITLRPLGFGTILADLDADGDQDLFVVNGHLMPNIHELHPGQTQAQADLLLENTGAAVPGAVPSFRDARARWLPAAAESAVSRGLLVGDLDGDGDLDLVTTRSDGPARLLVNSTNPARWVGFELHATASAPGAPGATVVLRGAGAPRLGVRRTGGSYLSAGDERVLFGLVGAAAGSRLSAEVAWPCGKRERFDVPKERAYLRLVEGTGSPAP